MAADAPEYLTWEGDSANGIGPRRPSTEDVGGDQKQDDEDFPPDPVEHYTAKGWNQKAKQIPALAKTAASAKMDVDFNAGTPFVAKVSAPSSNVVPTTFTVTDEGTGITLISWPSGTFPTAVCRPTGLTPYTSSASQATAQAQSVTNGIRVRTFLAGVAADLSFSFEIN